MYSKYKNRRVFFDGRWFDSEREKRRYVELKLLVKAGKISNLQMQVPFEIVINGMKVCKYIADFCYDEDGKRVTEDSKGMLTPVYKLKKKLMLAVHGIEIREV